MFLITPLDYLAGNDFCVPKESTDVVLPENIGGFDGNYHNAVLQRLNASGHHRVFSEYIFDDQVRQRYPNLDFKFNLQMHTHAANLQSFADYQQHPPIRYKNFLCSFNNHDHVGRRMLVAILKRFNWYNPDYVSKNFKFTVNELDGHINDYTDLDRLYRKFFITGNDAEFFNTTNSFNYPETDQFDNCNHLRNVQLLENKLTSSFIHLVSETLPTSYCTLYGEKFLYSVVTRGLFLAYAGPRWHKKLHQYYGFRLYNTLFDYSFDNIGNPVTRLVELATMISKYSMMSADDWQDLREIEKENIDFNYNHYFSGDYLKCLERYDHADDRIPDVIQVLEKLNRIND